MTNTNITNPYDVSRLDILLFLSFNKYVYVISSVMHAFWLVLTYDLLEDRRIDDVIIKTFALCYFKMAESFENLDDILADWVNEDFEKSLVEAVDSYDKQEKERKSRFSVENDLTKLLEQSQSNATKRNMFVRTSVTIFLFSPHFDVICNLLLNRRTANWNLFVKQICSEPIM